MVRPDDDASAHESQDERSLEEVQESIARADDKERAIGLIAAPIAAALSFLIIGTLVHNDPPLGTKNYVDPSLYHTLEFVLLGLSVAILAMALLRKRLFLGIGLVLYGLAVFNLHYWGFGVPFLMAGAWYLVRAYRLNQELKRVGAAATPRRKQSAPSIGAGRARTSGTRRRPDRLGSTLSCNPVDMNDPVLTEPQHEASSSSTSGTRGRCNHRDVSTESGRVGTLRGATVSFNPRRLVQGALGLVMVTLAVTAIVLTVAGIHSNDQINRLQTQGQPVTVTVTGCLGLLGGSGSNAAGYSCGAATSWMATYTRSQCPVRPSTDRARRCPRSPSPGTPRSSRRSPSSTPSRLPTASSSSRSCWASSSSR